MSRQMTEGEIYFTTEPDSVLAEIINSLGRPNILVVADTNTAEKCLPLLSSLLEHDIAILEAGEKHKNITSLQQLWKEMMRRRFLRSDLLINVGGGVVTDLGGFAAATYMRGIRYINIPTTLLADVDAASGGKTAIDFGGVKNIIGAFHSPIATIIAPTFLQTLPFEEILSGWGEMLKHAILDSEEHLDGLLTTHFADLSDTQLLSLIKRSIEVKRHIVAIDPKEQGLRRSLNLGHTCGHALEALCLQRGTPISHGHAVALGLLAELRLSPDFPKEIVERLMNHIYRLYTPITISDTELATLKRLLCRDKKNLSHSEIEVAFISMKAPGNPDIFAATDIDLLCNTLKEISHFTAHS